MARILHVNKFLYRRGGAEAYMQDVATLQVEAGHVVEYFGMQHVDNDRHTYAATFPSQVDFDPAPPSAAGKAMGVGRMLWSTSAARGIGQVLDDFKPDVVHLHNIYHQLSPSILRPIDRRGIPAVMTLHDYALACPTHNFMSHGEICERCIGGSFRPAVQRRCQGGSLAASAAGAAELAIHRRLDAYGSIDRFVCPSTFILTKMTEARIHPDRLVPLKHFVQITEAPKTLPGTGVLFIGRLSFEKGVDVLIEAMRDVPGDVELDILGDGPDRERLTDLASQVAPDRIRFHGRQPADKVSDWLRASAISVVPSRWYENQPLAVLESFCAGTPVVGTALGGITELIQPGVTGELFENGNVAQLANILGSLATDPRRCFEMGVAGRAWAETNLAPDVHVAGLDAIYAAAAKQRGRTFQA